MRSILRASQTKNRLSIEGDWKGLEEHYESQARTRRPFVWLHRRYLIPGNLETQHALFLFKQGRFEEAMAKANQAIRRIEGKPWIFRSFYSRPTFTTHCGALRSRILILGGMGRYEEARGVSAELEALTGTQGKPNPALALLEYYCGNIDKALALAQAAQPKDAQYDAMRGVITLCLILKGDFDEAIRALAYQPANAEKFYSPSGLEIMNKSPEGVELLALKDAKLAGIFPPAQLMKLAQVYIAREDFENAEHSLNQAKKSLGPEPSLQAAYHRHRARACAGLGKAAEADANIERLRAIAKERSRRSHLWEMHLGTGQTYFDLKRLKEALAELNEAEKVALHPIEKHSTTYWLAKTHHALGNRDEAIRYYEMVVADNIPSLMRTRAAEALIAVRQG